MPKSVTMEELTSIRREFAYVAEGLNKEKVKYPGIVWTELEEYKAKLEAECEKLVLQWIAQGCKEVHH